MVTSTRGPFEHGWYRILDDHGVIAGPVAAETHAALIAFIEQTKRDWPCRIRALRHCTQRYEPWQPVALPPGT